MQGKWLQPCSYGVMANDPGVCRKKLVLQKAGAPGNTLIKPAGVFEPKSGVAGR